MRLTVFLLVRLAGVVITDSNHGEDDTRSVDIWETINNINNRNNNNNTEDDREINEHINHQDHEVINQHHQIINYFLVTSSTTSNATSNNKQTEDNCNKNSVATSRKNVSSS